MLNDAELTRVSGGLPWQVYKGQLYEGSFSDLATEHGYKCWSWKEYYQQYLRYMGLGAMSADELTFSTPE